MRIHLLALSISLFVFNQSFGQFTLTVEITELRNDTGKIMLQLLDEKQKIIDQETCDIKDKKAVILIKNLTGGKYAVRFYHDENLNQVMETNVFGKPTEGYGFSNNVTGKFSMPPFEKWLFDLNGDKTIVIKTVY